MALFTSCRLCGDEKKADELVISLLDPTNILTFKEFVEYYCQLTLDPRPELPQKVCSRCKTTIDRFAAFSFTVSENQKKLLQAPASSETKQKIKEDAGSKPSDDHEKSTAIDATPLKAESSVLRGNGKKGEEPSIKKPKMNESFEDDDLLQEISFQEQIPDIQKSKTVRTLEEITKLFEPISPTCEKIQIPENEVGPHGQVPREWLARFEDFTSWEDFKYTCNHCNAKFDTLFSFTKHAVTLPASERTIKCHLCNSTSRNISYLGTYVNHMSREHYPHIKFCCIICSEAYIDMNFLIFHYQSQHKSDSLPIYPCLDCGFYSHCISALRTHKKQHDLKSLKASPH